MMLNHTAARRGGRLRTAGAVVAVSGLILLSAFSSAGAASADDLLDPSAAITTAEQVEVVAPAEVADAAEPADAAGPAEAAEAADAADASTTADPAADPAAKAPEPAVVPAPIDPPGAAVATPVALDDFFPGNTGVTKFLVSAMYINDSDPTSTVLEIDDPAGEVVTSGAWMNVPIAPGSTGTRTFQYRTSGPNGTSNWATVTVVIAPSTAVVPIAVADDFATTSGATLTIGAPGVMANDSHLGGTVTGFSDPAGQVVLQPDGSFVYTAPAAFVGTKKFSYQLTANGVPSGWAVVSITVTAPVTPVAKDDFYATGTNVDLDIPANGVLANDNAGTATVFANDDFTGEITLAADGALHYSPPFGFSGTKTLHYQLIDNGLQGNWATITIVVSPTPPPVAENDFYTMDMGTTLTLGSPGVLTNDSAGIVWWHGGNYSGNAVIYSGGSLKYTPDPTFTGLSVISYTIRDNYVTSNVATITINVVDPDVHGWEPTYPGDPGDPGDTKNSTTSSLEGSLAHAGVTSTWIAAPALSLVLLGSLALGFAARRRRSARIS